MIKTAEPFATKSDWLLAALAMKPGDRRLTIYPLDGLTPKMIGEALAAQKVLRNQDGKVIWRCIKHGTVIYLYRTA